MDLSVLIPSAISAVSAGWKIMEDTGINEKIKENAGKLVSFVGDLFKNNNVAKESLEQLKSNPEDTEAMGYLKTDLKRALKDDDSLQTQLDELINTFEESSKTDEKASTIISNSRNVVLGGISNVTGNIHIGDNINQD